MKLALSVCMMLLTALPGAAGADQRCSFNPSASVPLRIGEAQMPTIPVRMNNRDEILLVDTGAPISFISAGFAVELQLPRQPYPRGVLVTANGTSPEEFATVDTLSVGDLTGHNLRFFIVPSVQMKSTLAGSFGADFLQAWDVDFDFGGKKFNLIAPESCQGNPVYWTQGQHIPVPVHLTDEKHLRVSVKLDGKELSAVLDTGSSTSAMNLETAEMLFNLHESVLPAPHTAFNEIGREALLTGKMYEHTFKSLEIDGLSIPAPVVLLASDLHLGDEQLIIGMSELKKLHLYVSYKNQIVYITPAGAR